MAMDITVKDMVDALKAKAIRQEMLWRYYDGDHPLLFSNKKLEKIHRGAKYVMNWSAIVIDSLMDRLEITGYTAKSKALGNRLNDIWDTLRLAGEAEMVHEAVSVVGEAFVICDNRDTAFFNDPRHVVAFYDPENPHKMVRAFKVWQEFDERWYGAEYTPDYITLYEGSKGGDVPEDFRQFKRTTNPTRPEMPVFHFRISRRKLIGGAEKVISIQNAVNKQFSDMMVSSEFSAFKQRYAIGDFDVAEIEFSPDTMVRFPAGDPGAQDTSVGEFEAGTLSEYINSIESLVQGISSITRTPKHYFHKQGGDPSGEALHAQEAPLIRKVRRYIKALEPTWSELGGYLAGVTSADVIPMYGDPRTIQALSQAQTRRENVGAGLPLLTQLRDEGWREEELDQLLDDRLTERKTEKDATQDREAILEDIADDINEHIETAIEAIAQAALQKMVGGS